MTTFLAPAPTPPAPTAPPTVAPSVTPEVTPTVTPAPVLDLHGPGAFWFLALAGLVLVLLWFIPVLIDQRRAYDLRKRVIDFLRADALPAVARNGLTIGELRTLLRTVGEPANGQRSLARALMALSVTSIIGMVAFALLLAPSQEAAELRTTVVTALVSTLSVVFGFYFGSRATESAARDAAATTALAGNGPQAVQEPTLQVLQPPVGRPVTLSRDANQRWNPVRVQLTHPADTAIQTAVIGDSMGSLSRDPQGGGWYEYRPDSPSAEVTLLFWLREHPMAITRVDLRAPQP